MKESGIFFSPQKNQIEEIKLFFASCGLQIEEEDGEVKTIRRYGDLEKSGQAINFFHNRLFKKISSKGDEEDKNKDATGSTREAFLIRYDKNVATQNERDDAIAAELPNGKDTECYTKYIKYGNHNAMWEILSAHLYRLLGLEAPETMMAICEDYEEGKIPNIYVASPLITGYYDLGDFLVDETVITSFIAEKDLKIWRAEKDKVIEINQKTSNHGTITGEDKLARIKSLDKIYDLLPEYVHEEIEKSFAASKFIGNWDFANLNLNNIGVRFSFDKNRNVTSFKSVFVDFGNSGAIGFGGKYKELSLAKANTEAKIFAPESRDYDPELALNQDEINFISKLAEEKFGKDPNEKITEKQTQQAISSIWQTLADIEKNTDFFSEESKYDQDDIESLRKIVAKTSHHILESESSLKISKKTTGFLTFSDLPRNIPFAGLFKKVVTEKTAKIISQATSDNEENDDPFSNLKNNNWQGISQKDVYNNSEKEMAFRLSLITDEAIEKVINKWFLYENFPHIFSADRATNNNPQILQLYQTCAQVLEIYKEIRDVLLSSIPQEIVDQWVVRNPHKAIAAQEEIKLATLQESRQSDPDFENKYPFQEEIGDSARGKSASNAIHKSPSKSFSLGSKSGGNSNETLSSLEPEIINENNSFEQRLDRIKRHQSQQQNSIGDNPAQQIIKSIEGFGSQETEDCKNKKRVLEKIISQSADSEIRKEISIQLSNLEAERKQRNLSDLMEFISKNTEQWKDDLKISSQPNCNFFDLDRLRKIYRTKERGNLEVGSEQFLFSEENLARNAKIHQENHFVYDCFMKNLMALSTALDQKLSLDPHPSLPTAVTLERIRANSIC